MSRRFGRRQKRKMRQEIEDKERARAWLERDLSHLRAIAARDRQIVRDTARVLGDHFVTLDPQAVELRGLQHLAYQWRVYSQSTALPAFALEEAPTDLVEMTVRTLDVLRGSAELDRLRQVIHYKFTYGEKVIGYSVDRLAAFSLGGEFKRYASEQLGRATQKMVLDMSTDWDR